MPTPLYRIKLVTNQKYTERPLNTRTCLIVDIFILKISTIFRSFFIVCLASEIFSLINYLVRSCWCFSTELGSPLKVVKNESAAPSITKYFLVSTHWRLYFQFWILIMKGVKSCSRLSGFSLRPYLSRQKKKISVIAGKSGFYQPVLRRTSVYFIVRFLYLRHLNFQYRSSFQTV